MVVHDCFPSGNVGIVGDNAKTDTQDQVEPTATVAAAHLPEVADQLWRHLPPLAHETVSEPRGYLVLQSVHLVCLAQLRQLEDLIHCPEVSQCGLRHQGPLEEELEGGHVHIIHVNNPATMAARGYLFVLSAVLAAPRHV